MRFCIVGSGLSGCIMARHLARLGHHVIIVEQRSHIGGNCHTYRDEKTGIMIHAYGPHIFHTADKEVWDFIRQFGTFRPYLHRVKGVSKGRVYSLPVNLFTINQLFGKNLSPDEARQFIENKTYKYDEKITTFEQQALGFVGKELYEAFFEGYTQKQWGCSPSLLPASILKRLPLRFNYDDNYFSHPYQGMPEEGYTQLMENMIKGEKNIEIRLNTSFDAISREKFDHIFYTGPLDGYFDFKLGRLKYRSLKFERIDDDRPDYQGTSVMNYCDKTVPYTRITEHKHFAYWEEKQFDKTVCFREYPKEATPNDIPYYPVRLAHEQKLLAEYIKLAQRTPGVSFMGRLGTYKYLDMDVTIREALNACKIVDQCLIQHKEIPAFFA